MLKYFLSLLFITALTTFPQGLEAQPTVPGEDGGPTIDFHNISLEEALALALNKNKLVFVDAYTDWCGPCKTMEQTVLREKEVVDYINGNFVSLKINMEKGEGPDVGRRYKIAAYPTYILVEGDGTLRHTISGARATGADFIAELEEGMSEDVAVGLLARRYEQVERGGEFMMKYTEALFYAGDSRRAAAVSHEFLSSLPPHERVGQQYWYIYENPWLSAYDTANFDFLLENRAQFVDAVGQDVVDARIAKAFNQRLEQIYLGYDRSATPDYIEGIRERIAGSALPDKEVLASHAAMALTRAEGDLEVMLAELEKLAPAWGDKEVGRSFFILGTLISTHGDSEMRTRLVALCDTMLASGNLTSMAGRVGTFRYVESRKLNVE